MNRISDDLAVAQTIIMNSGKGIRFSRKQMDRLKQLMQCLGFERLQAGGYVAIWEGDVIKIRADL